jgi:ribosome-binding factor A
MDTQHEQRTLRYQELASEFIALNSNRESLITVTNTVLSKKGDRVTFYVSVYPEDAESPALGFLMRKRGDVREYLKEKASLARIPHVEFLIDDGEKSRQRVDELLNQ